MMRHNPVANSYIYLVFLLTLVLAGCDTSQQQSVVEITDSSFRLIAPDTLTTPRAVDPDEIWPVVKLGTDIIIDMTQNGDAWTGSVNVPANTIQTLSISWFIKFQNRDLELARFQQSYSIGADGINVPLGGSTAYNTDIDTDNDNVSNLDELTNQSNPFVLDDGLDVVDVLITERASGEVPVIDGLGATYSADAFELAGEWAGTVQNDVQGTALLVNNLMIDNNGVRRNGVPFHRWAATHDGTYLYLLVLVDDIGSHQSDSTGLEDDDSLEIFIDGNNSKLETYTDDDDIYLQIALLEAGNTTPNNSSAGSPRFKKGFFSAPIPEDLTFATGPNQGPLSFLDPDFRQDAYEVRISIAELGITRGERFGIDIQINDDDDGTGRDGKWGWIHPPLGTTDIVDGTWRIPRLMATAVIQ